MSHKHGEAGGAHDHAEDGEPHVSHADGGVQAVADAQHVTHGLEEGVGVLLTPSVVLQEEQRVGRYLDRVFEPAHNDHRVSGRRRRVAGGLGLFWSVLLGRSIFSYVCVSNLYSSWINSAH